MLFRDGQERSRCWGGGCKDSGGGVAGATSSDERIDVADSSLFLFFLKRTTSALFCADQQSGRSIHHLKVNRHCTKSSPSDLSLCHEAAGFMGSLLGTILHSCAVLLWVGDMLRVSWSVELFSDRLSCLSFLALLHWSSNFCM